MALAKVIEWSRFGSNVLIVLGFLGCVLKTTPKKFLVKIEYILQAKINTFLLI